VGLIRNPEHATEIEALGATATLCDLEKADAAAVAVALKGCDTAVFAAGAGAGSSAERKLTVDRDGAIKLLAAATRANVTRFLILSSVGAENPPNDDEIFSVYLRAKAAADAAIAASDLEWTILRPGALTDDLGTGKVRLDATSYRGEVPRDDVAATIVALLLEPRAIGRTFYVNAGPELIADAVASAVA
jgi:uncharacterized protein YbjT (DUF2867 family)